MARIETPRVIVVGNEKGGAGKSTIVLHLACALLHGGARATVMDLDLRQQSTARFFSNRRTWAAAANAALPMPPTNPADLSDALLAMEPGAAAAALQAAADEALAQAGFVIIDTPGADTPLSRAAHAMADLVITPINDSFVDFDMLGHVDPVTLELTKPSLYSETVWESRKQKMVKARRSMDWLVLRNRLATTEARNRKRLDERVAALSRRVGFRIGPGLRDRVIYRELFPFGLTVADLSPAVRPVPVSLTHVAARHELRSIMAAAGLQGFDAPATPEAASSATPDREPAAESTAE